MCGVQSALAGQAAILIDEGHCSEAEPLLLESIELCKELGVKDVCAEEINLGLIYDKRGNSDKAFAHYKKAEQVAREIKSPFRLAESIGFQACVHAKKGNKSKAMELYRKEERICRKLGEKSRLWQSLANQAVLLVGRYEFDSALKKASEALGIVEKNGYSGYVEELNMLLAQINAGPRIF